MRLKRLAFVELKVYAGIGFLVIKFFYFDPYSKWLRPYP